MHHPSTVIPPFVEYQFGHPAPAVELVQDLDDRASRLVVARVKRIACRNSFAGVTMFIEASRKLAVAKNLSLPLSHSRVAVQE